LPFGVSAATTWLNLMTIGASAAAGPIIASAATAVAARINLRISPPQKLINQGPCARTSQPGGSITDKPPRLPLPL
jgi:hypothetical protein